MHYIIIGIVVIFVIVCLGRHILFNPRVNSVITIIALAILVIRTEPIMILLIIISVIDCVRDIVRAEDYYEDIEISIDRLYMTKSLLSIMTLGFVRAAFLLIVYPILYISVSSDIKRKVAAGLPMSNESQYSKLELKNYYYGKQISKLEENGIVISNKRTVDAEAFIRRKKLERLYPEKFIASLADMVSGDKDMKEKRRIAEDKLKSYTLHRYYAYLRPDIFDQYPRLITEAMSSKGKLSTQIIKQLDELKDLNLTLSFGYGVYQNNYWSEYFIIQALNPLVADGTFEDDDLNDKDPLDNHAYRYTKSTKTMPSIDGDNDPRFVLD